MLFYRFIYWDIYWYTSKFSIAPFGLNSRKLGDQDAVPQKREIKVSGNLMPTPNFSRRTLPLNELHDERRQFTVRIWLCLNMFQLP